MAKDFNYDRRKSTQTNDTPINITIEGAESPTAEAALAAGSTGIATLTFIGDADESGGASLSDLGKFVITPVLPTDSDAKLSFTVQFTPVGGAGADGTAVSHTFEHEESMDAWQAAAGRAQQA